MAEQPSVALLLSHHAGYDRGILRGIAKYCRIHGHWNLYVAGVEPGLPLPEMETFSGGPPSDSTVGRLPDLRKWGVRGIIGRLQNRNIVRMALAIGKPVIAMDLSAEQLSAEGALAHVSEIRSDSYRAGRMAAEHLLERSFRRFGFCGYAGRTWSDSAREGFCARLAESGYPCDVYEPSGQRRAVLWQQERPRAANWLACLAKPVGILCCNDIRGRQLLVACASRGLAVPDDVAGVGIDDDQLLCELTNPPLSSVVLNSEQGGFQAAELLDALMSGREKKPRRIDVEPLWVLARQSTDVLAVDDPDVAAALRYIREHQQSPIGVQDVVAQANLSRRALELRFQKALGRSIRSEIQRARLTWAKRLLVETNLSIAKIAARAGFKGHSYLSEVFHRQTGQSPAAYRRRHRAP